MSTYIYLQCLDHTPSLTADSESGQHLYDLPQLRADIHDREVLTRLHHDGADLGYFRNHTAAFLSQHPTCHLGIIDETGEHHPTHDLGPT